MPASRLPGSTRFFGSRGSPNRGRAEVSSIDSAYDETVVPTTA
jgi:hypothetical protein